MVQGWRRGTGPRLAVLRTQGTEKSSSQSIPTLPATHTAHSQYWYRALHTFLSVFRFLTACLVCTKWNIVFSLWVQKLKQGKFLINSLDIGPLLTQPTSVTIASNLSCCSVAMCHRRTGPQMFRMISRAGNKPLQSFISIEKTSVIVRLQTSGRLLMTTF